MTNEIELRLKWHKTWEDRENDFAAEAPAYGLVGRIYVYTSGPSKGRWIWSLTAHGGDVSRNIGKLSGYAESAREAAKEVENAWFAAIKGTVHDRPAAPARNA